MESQESPLFNCMLPAIYAVPKPWQVQHEINIEICVMLLPKLVPTLCC